MVYVCHVCPHTILMCVLILLCPHAAILYTCPHIATALQALTNPNDLYDAILYYIF